MTGTAGMVPISLKLGSALPSVSFKSVVLPAQMIVPVNGKAISISAAAADKITPRRSVKRKILGMKKSAAPALEAVSRLGRSGGEEAHALGRRIDEILMGRPGRDAPVIDAHYAPAPVFFGMAGTLVSQPALHSPAKMYAQAYKEALKAARKMGRAEHNLFFGETTAVMPVRDGAQWKFNFYVLDEPGQVKASAILVELDNGIAAAWGKYRSRVQVYEDVAVPADPLRMVVAPARLMAAVRVDPQAAYASARKGYPGLGQGVSVSLQLHRKGDTGPRTFWYHFFDENGAEVAVDAIASRIRVVRETKHATLQERTEQWKLSKRLRDLDSWMGDNFVLYGAWKWVALVGAAIWLLDMLFGLPELIAILVTLLGLS